MCVCVQKKSPNDIIAIILIEQVSCFFFFFVIVVCVCCFLFLMSMKKYVRRRLYNLFFSFYKMLFYDVEQHPIQAIQELLLIQNLSVK